MGWELVQSPSDSGVVISPELKTDTGSTTRPDNPAKTFRPTHRKLIPRPLLIRNRYRIPKERRVAIDME